MCNKIKRVFIVLSLCCIYINAQAQEQEKIDEEDVVALDVLKKNQLDLELGFGMTLFNSKDNAISPNLYHGLGLGSQFKFIWLRPNSKNYFRGRFQYANLKIDQYFLASATAYKGDFDVIHLRKFNFIPLDKWRFYLGVNLNFSGHYRSYPHLRNNSDGYEISSSLGLAIAFDRTFTLWKRKFGISYIGTSPLVNYAIRPAYTPLGYPAGFLEDGVFNERDEGLAEALLKSGEFGSLNNLIRLDSELALTFHFNKNKNSIRLIYAWEYYNYKSIKESSLVNKSILFALVTAL